MATYRLRRIGSNIDPRNTASARIAQKLGAVPEGTTDWAGVTARRVGLLSLTTPGFVGTLRVDIQVNDIDAGLRLAVTGT
jgi:hypothetical protein